MTEVRLPYPCVVVLVGASGSGKSTWAAAHFRPEQVVSSDALRALVGEGPYDQRAGTDAFAVLDLVLERRAKRGLLTVVDTLGLEAGRRLKALAVARRHGLPCHAVVFATAADVCRARNKARAQPVPSKVLSQQLATAATVDADLATEGFDGVHAAGPTVVVPPAVVDAPSLATRQREDPMALRFGLQIPSFTWPGGRETLGADLARIASSAEEAGFTSLWVMDHFVQIPLVGPEWHDMLDSWTTLAYLAAHTSKVTLGPLVGGVTYRNVGHLAKIVATLDVLSGGRAVCGIGAAWFEREHKAYGWRFPPLAERYALLEDALQALPVLWGPGSPAFEGKVVSIPEAICYPRPLQEHVPLLVGGSGERRTLKLVAQYADACNLFGDAATVTRKVGVLHDHCAAVGRDPAEITVTHLATALIAPDRGSLAKRVERVRTPSMAPEAFAARVNAGTVEDHIGRFRGLAEAGVQTAIMSLADIDDPAALEAAAEVIAAFSTAGH